MMTPLETLARELSPEVAAAAMRALFAEAERIREGRSGVRVMIVFFTQEEEIEPQWGKGIDPNKPGRYNDIHGPQGSQTQ